MTSFAKTADELKEMVTTVRDVGHTRINSADMFSFEESTKFEQDRKVYKVLADVSIESEQAGPAAKNASGTGAHENAVSSFLLLYFPSQFHFQLLFFFLGFSSFASLFFFIFDAYI